MSGDGAADIFPKSRVITRQLTAGKGTVELPFKIPASVSGDITFTISGIRQCGVMDMNTSVSSADINLLGLKTLTPDAEYISRTTTTGWIAENASVQQGGNSNSDPMFQFIGSEDERAICLSGNKSAPGVLMSPVLNGFKFRGMEFGIAFDGYNQVDLLMEIIQNGKSVKSTRFQYEIPKFQMFIPGSDHLFDFEGICQVKITNLCPSNISNRNADQITIHRLYYWQYE